MLGRTGVRGSPPPAQLLPIMLVEEGWQDERMDGDRDGNQKKKATERMEDRPHQ